MERFGFIHEKLDIKILILFLLRRLPGEVEPSELGDLCRDCDSGIGYFEYSDCVAELIETGHIRESENGFSITEKGARNVDAVESSLPYSVRTRAQKLLEPLAEELRRQAMITARHDVTDEGCFVELAMSDGAGEIIRVRLLVADEEQARRMEKNFRKGAEGYYHKAVALFEQEPERRRPRQEPEA